uniref:Dynein regulatory complex subunit 3 n=1 Tax=Stegastes partitus TaxID=144197 RepID=A0A3B5A4C1_9TELE
EDSTQPLHKPTLMTEEFLEKSVFEQFPKQDCCFPNFEDIHFSEIQELCLGYNSETNLKITSWCVNVCSNHVGKIQGLDMLTNQTHLNLSFNNIENIEGLENLWKLELLVLANNRISVIENIDTLENVPHLQIANNLIGQLDNALQLKKFKKLFTLFLFGNPVSKQENYRDLIATHMPDLRVTQSSCLLMHELRCKHDAFVESLNGPCLFMSMFQDDPEAEALRCVPGIASLWDHVIISCVFAFIELRALEDNYYQVKKIAVSTLEKVAKGNLEEDLPREVVKVSISDREIQLVTGVSGWKMTLIKANQDKELKLNHMHISDTQRFVEYLKEQLELWQKQSYVPPKIFVYVVSQPH